MKHEDLKKKKEQEGTTQTYTCSGIYSIYGGVYYIYESNLKGNRLNYQSLNEDFQSFQLKFRGPPIKDY